MTITEQRTNDAILSINRKMKDANQIDWEQRRYEIAKDVLNGMMSSLSCPYDDQRVVDNLTKLSVRYADALIQELKVTP